MCVFCLGKPSTSISPTYVRYFERQFVTLGTLAKSRRRFEIAPNAPSVSGPSPS
uniref:Uncharacterized protein n=1 Tax=Physcomitrium patens TaxID=3218 RepID=A0A2K1L018_PHYPA|nr:hypothetical protein PHYPA_002163 [Physcomitrium patens]